MSPGRFFVKTAVVSTSVHFFVMHTTCDGLVDGGMALSPFDVERRTWISSEMEEKHRTERIMLLLNQAFCVNEF